MESCCFDLAQVHTRQQNNCDQKNDQGENEGKLRCIAPCTTCSNCKKALLSSLNIIWSVGEYL